MKALGVKVLNYISALYQMQAISAEERNEFARLIQLAMSNPSLYRAVLVKLIALDETAVPNTPTAKYIEECIDLIQSASSQAVG